MKKKNIVAFAIVTVLILLVPLIAMQFTNEVNWSPFDFVFMGTLLFGTGLVYEFVASRAAGSVPYKVAVGIATIAALLLVWVNAAVGIIGDGGNFTTPIYFGVLVIGLFAAIIGRFKPMGMARALFVTALAQALVPVTALLVWGPATNSWGERGVLGVFILNSFFVAMFVVSGLLFRYASRRLEARASV